MNIEMIFSKTNLFRKKFKVRISYYEDDLYTIEYSYGWFTIWKEIKQFLCPFGAASSISAWNPVFKVVGNAQHFAKQFKCIEDVNLWYQKENEKASAYYQKRKEYLQKARPFRSKQIL